ncbi:hypothetical protein BJ508DRAFT_416474 [Ascobolus immersus RN42]|uniref:INSIG domain-containing protein n=1 Tax=Ascobolus immersus RN42 TaxID=1160509 RepID=A0A3N4HZQ7_ASCIM|nr:hypothetical protein BJ508DRAFT_416474 [Ascobolus immersus RN42]
MSEDLPILRPKARRPFELPTDTPSGTNTPSTPTDAYGTDDSPFNSPTTLSSSSRSKSTVALNASTLSGIYPQELMDEQPTPLFGSRIGSLVDMSSAKSFSNGTLKADDVYEKPAKLSPILLLARLVSLFAVGIGYGLVVAHFHDQKIMTRGWEAIVGEQPWYLVYWGLAGIALGLALPALDRVLKSATKKGNGKSEDSGEWNVIVRSIGAFIGIAFAIRKLSWESALQASLTLALVNPFLWYLVDRTRPGFWFAAGIAVFGTVIVQNTAPNSIQLPQTLASTVNGDVVFGNWTNEGVALATWIASVLFCSSVTFGNVGRLFAFKGATVA